MSKIPPTALTQLCTKLIGEGALVEELDTKLLEGHESLKRHLERTGNKRGKVTIDARITMNYDADLNAHVVIHHEVNMKTPKVRRSMIIKELQGKLLVRPDGNVDTEQMRLFDDTGNALGVVMNGEIKDEDPVLGKVGSS